MTRLFIASRSIPHEDDGSRRIVVAGAFIGDDLHVKGPHKGAVALANAVIAGRLKRELAEEAARRPA